MGTLYGDHHEIHAKNTSDILKCLEANFPSIRQYLATAVEQGVEFSLLVNDQYTEESNLLEDLKEGDVTISPIVSGAKSGGAKILAAAAIFAVLLIPGGAAAVGMGSNMVKATSTIGGALANAGGGYALAATTAMSIATNLALTGISQLMAPDPSVDREEENGYLYSGNSSSIVEGDPVPVLYGELLIPGQPISFAIKSVSQTAVNEDRNDFYSDINGELE